MREDSPIGPAPVRPRRWVRRIVAAAAILVLSAVVSVIVLTSTAAVPNVKVAILDGGIDPTFPALAQVSIDVHPAPGSPSRVSKHGTAIAAILAENALYGSATGSPEIEILDVPTLDASGVGEVETLAAGIETAAQQDVDMVVAALGVEVDAPALEKAVSQAQEDGVTILAAAGNGIGAFASYPAQYEGVISVGALNKSGQRLRFTNTRAANLLAPGEDIRVEAPGGGTEQYSGTSPATAIAAGKIVACWPLIAPRTLDHTSRNTPVDQAIEESIKAQGKDPRGCNSL